MSLARSFARAAFARFINRTPGRVVRIASGLGLIAWGIALRAEVSGTALIVVGLVPLLAGSVDRCLVSALLGGPIRAVEVRKSAGAG